jgi:pimeloyl-ACP methyl ester carboxylesterase
LNAGAAAELRHNEADLGDVTLHYVEAGPPDGRLALMLHGFPQFWWLWDEQLRELGDTYRVVAPDMRGYNLSSKPQEAEAYRMRHLLADVDELVEHLGGRPFTLVGHDWGGIIAWAFACRGHPKLERLVVLDGPPPWTWGRELERSPRQRQAVRYMVELSRPAPHGEELLGANDMAVLDSLVLEPGLSRGYLTEADRARYHEAWSRPGALTGGLNYYRASGMGTQVEGGQPAEVRARMNEMRVDVPTLVIWGTEDNKLLPGLTEGLEQWVADVRVELLDGAGHWTPQERPAEVSRLIREFVSSG